MARLVGSLVPMTKVLESNTRYSRTSVKSHCSRIINMWGDEGDEGDVDEMDYEEEHADDEENIDPEELEDEDTKATKVSFKSHIKSS
jgi:hypothetical protein